MAEAGGGAGSALPAAAKRLIDLIAEHPDGLTSAELIAVAQTRFPRLDPRRVTDLVARALAAGAVHETGGRLHGFTAAMPTATTSAQETAPAPSGSRPLRAVALDLESVVKTTATEPYLDKRIFQIGVVRFGTDADWVAADPRRDWFLVLPDPSWEIRSSDLAARHANGAVSPAQALEELHAYTADADMVVTYNGTEADFRLLAAAYEREGLPSLAPALVDAYYLTLALWPTQRSHRLAELADVLGVDRSGLGWHDAGDDAELLARLMRHAGDNLTSRPAGLVDLIAAVCADSPAWTLVRHLAAASAGAAPGEAHGTVRVHGVGDVAAVLGGLLTGHQPRRLPPGTPATAAPGRRSLTVDAGLRGDEGRVDPAKLAQTEHQGKARRRPAQEVMTAALHTWADAGVPALVEAPTGTGKSYAALAAALDWLAGGPNRTAIITTFTKQLQAQLADDVASLDAHVPGLLAVSDVVKGQSNRLSLRALSAALADATTLDARRSRRPGNRNRFLERPAFRELLAFLTLRLIASTDVLASWAAHSVDPVDCPAFFTGYAGPVLPVWLESLSQAANGEYDAGSGTPVAAHTDAVAEALATHRLLLANHALLLAHIDDLQAMGSDTLLIVDEAHQLEDAATSALTKTLDYRAVEDLLSELAAWTDGARRSPERDAVLEAVGNLEILLDHEQLPRVAGHAFDARGTGAGVVVGSRTVTLASAYAGTSGIGQVRTLTSLLLRLSGQCEALVGALSAYRSVHGPSLDFFEHERIGSLLARCAQVEGVGRTIVDDVDAIIGPSLATGGPAASVPGMAGLASGPASTPAAGPSGASVVTRGPAADGGDPDADGGDPNDDSDDLTDPDDPAPDADGDDPDADGTDDDDSADGDDRDGDDDTAAVPLGPLPPGTSNRVVYAEELEALRAGLRRYRFRIATSPVELGADTVWQQFLATFARTYYVSATLRVAGSWQFIRDRLGLSPAIPTMHLPTPFDYANQAELVCFADFPSWAEQSDGAMRTVAHQLAGYTREIVTPVDPALDVEGNVVPGSRGGYDGGALVLTTARSTAGGIAEYLASGLRAREDQTPVLSALVLGNPRAVRQFTDAEHGGGVLVGTKGLWQGVDVADEERLRLVWINKLPFAPFAAPVIEARRAAVTVRAEAAHADDPDAVATEHYYLPLAALQLRQAAGRLIRSERHRGVIVISDRKLAGQTALRRAYRQTFLGSLDDGLLRDDPVTGERGGGNVMPMAEGWARIWNFYARHGLLSSERADQLSTPDALDEHTLLPQTRRIRQLALTPTQVAEHTAAGTLEAEVLSRTATVGGLLNLSDDPATLKPAQQQVIAAVAAGRNVLGLLPTGFGKSFCFQLPALVLPGVTLVVSPLVALMHDQALELNRSIGGAVRALVAPLRESSSRAGKTEVADQLLGRADHGIRMVYVSPERLCQRRFRELVRAAVAAGVVTRIAVDEAHTVVQWDDFRPSMSRVEQFLAQLRRDHGLPVTALTATANRTVLAGLREGVFGLDPEPAGGPAGEAAEAAAGTLLTVRENPIRPELAIFRRTMRQQSPAIVAGLAEEVLDAIDDHAIFYCLTVKEVVALHAHLRDYLGEGGVRIRRFHGRLTEAEKSAVMTEFREAPRRGEEGFAPLIIVATSAFGLGVNRPDVRTVFCVSAPTDLAALYQQLGRAGRDAAGTAITGADPGDPDGTGEDATGPAEDTGDVQTPTPVGAAACSAVEPRRANVGLTLLTTRGLRLVQFMTGSDLRPGLLEQMGRAVLSAGTVVDAAAVADDLIGADLTAGHLTVDEARKPRTTEAYTAGVMRALAALAGLGAVSDLGDFPPLCTIKPGELLNAPRSGSSAGGRGTEADDVVDVVEERVVIAVLALPVRPTAPGKLHRQRLDVAALDGHLAATVAQYRAVADDAAGTWQLLADLHDRGLLDVSAAPSRRLITGLAVHATGLPGQFLTAVTGKAARAATEIALLRSFFADTATCANRKFADYFGVVDLPKGCCTTAANRCSACWDDPTWPAGETKPGVAVALETPRPRPAGTRTDATFARQRLDEQVHRLVWEVYHGVRARDVFRALRGEDSYYVPTTRRRVRLRTGLVNSRYFGANPAIRLDDIEDALVRLQAEKRVEPDGPRWREAGHLRRERARAISAAAAGGTGGRAGSAGTAGGTP
ncbi:DEAD/DEAH box helicase [Blastococcus sp. HT6-30]|uniref:DEAD/DEAH box helicase n=1 Tax=Blastococcus sp. HT6-30 TaxID=3144843 RepID=UPI00321BBA2D